MSFLGSDELIDLINTQAAIAPFNINHIKNAAYELSLGSEVYLTDSSPRAVEQLGQNKRSIDINPGQFALLLTLEKVHVPRNKIAFISIKAGIKLKGLVNVSGFHVDPGFNDHLVFSVYNAGPAIITLNTGECYFPIWFAELTNTLTPEEAYNQNNVHFNKFSHIPTDMVERLKLGDLASPKAILDKINRVHHDLDDKINKAQHDLDEKIIKAEETKGRNEWLYKIVIGLFIAISLKSLWDWGAYDRGYDDAKNAKKINDQIMQSQQSFVDSIINKKMDSVLHSLVRKDSSAHH